MPNNQIICEFKLAVRYEQQQSDTGEGGTAMSADVATGTRRRVPDVLALCARGVAGDPRRGQSLHVRLRF